MIALLLCVILIGACHRPGPFGPNRLCGKKWHSRFHDRGVDQILGRLDKGVKDLNLTDEQPGRYENLRSQLEEDLYGMGQNRRAFFIELKDEVDREEPNMAKVAGLLKQKIDLVEDRMTAHIDSWLEFYQILNEGQKAQVIGALRERMEGCGPF